MLGLYSTSGFGGVFGSTPKIKGILDPKSSEWIQAARPAIRNILSYDGVDVDIARVRLVCKLSEDNPKHQAATLGTRVSRKILMQLRNRVHPPRGTLHNTDYILSW